MKKIFFLVKVYIWGRAGKHLGVEKMAALLLLLCGCFPFRYTACYVCIYALSGSGEHTMAYIHNNMTKRRCLCFDFAFDRLLEKKQQPRKDV